MKRTDPRITSNIESTIALRDLLRLVISEPSAFADNSNLIHALKSQGRTAGLIFKFKDASGHRTTQSMSLNTLKLYANDIFERGFEGFNDLRIGALDAIIAFKERSKSANKRTKTGLAKKVTELEAELDKHRRINFILLQGLQSAVLNINSIKNAPNNKLREKRAEYAIEKLRVIVAMNPAPFDSLSEKPSIVELNGTRKDDEKE